MPEVKTQRSFHGNGQLASEVTLVDGLPNGVTRIWNWNGVLTREMEVRNGIVEGIAKQWNDQGVFLGSYEIRNGNGIAREWADNGLLVSEITLVGGLLTGRQRIWCGDGEIMSDIYWIRGRKVPRKKYLAACLADPSLPNYAGEPAAKTRESKLKALQKPAKEPPSSKPDPARQARVEELLEDNSRQEAHAWLKEVAESQTRTLGELPNWTESVALVEEAYEAGVLEVFVAKVDRYDDGVENTGTLLVRLPTKSKQRKSALSWCNQQIGFQGFEPERDTGQEWLIVRLD